MAERYRKSLNLEVLQKEGLNSEKEPK